MEKVDLNVKVRTDLTRPGLTELRRQGGIPAVIYAEGQEAISLEIDSHHYMCQTAGKPQTQIYNIRSEKAELEGKMALIKSVQREPIKEKVLHIDFYMITAGTKIVVTVPLKVVGECRAVKSGEAILNQTAYDAEVECLPREIPEFIEVDVSGLEEGQSIHFGDLKISENITLKSEPSISIVGALAKKAEEEPTPEAASEEATTAEGEAKPEGEAAAAEGGEKPKSE